ncbi:MAG: succinate dehydrogenase cytochrome b subunit [Nitrospirae bacterium]|nr:succinate dehydrogenase cytochrome b subunit [Nitrospirota bacterium]
MQFLKSSIGRKIVMALSGLIMVLFVIAHMLGNASVFAGPDGINAYAAKLQGFGPFIWVFRLIMLSVLSLHVYFGILLTLENRAARPAAYTVKKDLRSTFASRTMIWTGLVIAVYLVYHLLHFTFHVINPGISSAVNVDASGRPDVFRMVVLGLQDLFTSFIYIAAVIASALHLTHGIQSAFQTLGGNNDRTFPVITKAGTIAAGILLLGYISIPLAVIAGVLKH